MREHFMLDPQVVFLNHGSFGACPRPVFEVYQNWQQELERQPVAFLSRRADGLLDEARARLATYLNAPTDHVLFVNNATSGINLVARSLKLQPGDEILGTDHEYGALEMTWDFVCERTGAQYISQPIPLPLTTPEAFIETFWQGVTPRTKVIYLSHITSPTALIFPIEEICRRARAAGILTIIDGAHAPSQIPLDMEAIGADFYSGNCHKWLCAPKGSAFLYARPEHHAWLEPLVISWGWQDNDQFSQPPFIRQNQYQGTSDPAAYLSVPAAIDFQQAHDWNTVRARCHQLASQTRAEIAELTGLAPIAPDDPRWFGQMAASPLPALDHRILKQRLYDEFCIEVPINFWNERPHIRVSFQAYNTADDAQALLRALRTLLPS